ncbi:MAG: phage holin family protein [Microbacterium sp.]
MIRFLIRTAIALVTSALALLVCSWIFADFHVSAVGFITAVVVFTVAHAILGPFIFNVARRYANAILGGIGLVTTFVALLIASLFPGGLRIDGVVTWILATLVIWIITALGLWLLPLIFLKEKLEGRKA